MDFRFTDEQENFRSDIKTFIESTLTNEFWSAQEAKGTSEGREERSSPEFSRMAADAGWLAVAWPEEYGGAGLSYTEQMIYMEEMAEVGAPQEHHRRAVQQVGPSIILFGNEEQKQEYLPQIAKGELSFAMGLSEPDAGSDLASANTRAVKDGDFYTVNGQKKWTSGAHYSDLLWTVVRTDPNAPKHRGLSMLIIPLDAEGVVVEPILDMQGEHHFNKVHFEDVKVPIENIVGEENRGWYVNASTMDFERSGIARIASLRRALKQATTAHQVPQSGHTSESKRTRLADLSISTKVSELLAYRVVSQQASGLIPNYEVSITKLLASEVDQAIHNLHVGIDGLFGNLSFSKWATSSNGGSLRRELRTSANGYISAIPGTIAQGSSEIQRNVIATRGLGLPRG